MLTALYHHKRTDNNGNYDSVHDATTTITAAATVTTNALEHPMKVFSDERSPLL